MSASFQRENVEPGEGDVGGDGEAEEGPDGEEHAVGGDEGEEEDAKRGENQRAVHHEKGIHKCKIGKPPFKFKIFITIIDIGGLHDKQLSK